MNDVSKHIEFKKELINFLRHETVGPNYSDDSSIQGHKLKDSPKSIYSSGMLFQRM